MTTISSVSISTESLELASERLGQARALQNAYQIVGDVGKISIWASEAEIWESRRMLMIYEHPLRRTVEERSDEIVRRAYGATFIDITRNV